ncbi:MAG: Gfo/Idh/MocA family oxidoreductase [Gemmatales bacterium]|nr:Gfo/Idh/MocA family oxidoreductase [Gemmatales bacterium]MDW8387129.1 Gfo/Idh/MocA family oxidoreductase [Gemmatales bacterium]
MRGIQSGQEIGMVRIGIVGIGFMGMIHFLAARKLQGAAVTALHSRDPKKLAGDWRSIQGNFGPRGEMMDLSGFKKYQRFEDLLADADVDLVDICLPTHLHAPAAIAALKAGKHVLVEKAIALTPEDAEAMVEAARQAQRLLMVAHVLPFFPEFAFAFETIRSGRYGKLLAGQFIRVISKPDWSADIADAAKTGGPAVDLHVHDTHFIGLIGGVPRAVFSRGVVNNGVVEHLTTQYVYDDGPALSCTSGAICQKARPFVHGYELYLEQATLTYQSDGRPLTVLHADGNTEKPALSGGDDATAAFTAELQCAADAVRSGKEPDLLSGRLARDALVMCFKEIESVRTGQAVPL